MMYTARQVGASAFLWREGESNDFTLQIVARHFEVMYTRDENFRPPMRDGNFSSARVILVAAPFDVSPPCHVRNQIEDFERCYFLESTTKEKIFRVLINTLGPCNWDDRASRSLIIDSYQSPNDSPPTTRNSIKTRRILQSVGLFFSQSRYF